VKSAWGGMECHFHRALWAIALHEFAHILFGYRREWKYAPTDHAWHGAEFTQLLKDLIAEHPFHVYQGYQGNRRQTEKATARTTFVVDGHTFEKVNGTIRQIA
jgi:hypothetical protein